MDKRRNWKNTNQTGEGSKMGHLKVLRRPIEVLHGSRVAWLEQ